MTILLVELESKGHHISSYIRSVVHNLIKNKKKIIFLTSEEIKKNDYYEYLKNNTRIIFVKKIKYPSIKNYINLLKFQFDYYNLIKKKVREIDKKFKIEHIYINTLDFFDKPISVLGSPFKNINFSCLYLNPKFYFDYQIFSMEFIKKIIYQYLFYKILNIKKLKNIFFIDPLCFNYLIKKKLGHKRKITYIEDLGTGNQINKFSLSKKKCRNILKINQKDFVILVYGSIRKTKSLKELFDVIELLENNNLVKILIAGQQDEFTKNYLKDLTIRKKNLKKQIIIIDKYINDKLEKILFKASDLTWTGYSKKFYGSGGVFFLSCINKTPVITSNHGAIGWYGKKYNVGISIDLTNKKILLNQLNKFLKREKTQYNFNFVNKKHNFLNFGKKITDKILLNF